MHNELISWHLFLSPWFIPTFTIYIHGCKAVGFPFQHASLCLFFSLTLHKHIWMQKVKIITIICAKLWNLNAYYDVTGYTNVKNFVSINSYTIVVSCIYIFVINLKNEFNRKIVICRRKIFPVKRMKCHARHAVV